MFLVLLFHQNTILGLDLWMCVCLYHSSTCWRVFGACKSCCKAWRASKEANVCTLYGSCMHMLAFSFFLFQTEVRFINLNFWCIYMFSHNKTTHKFYFSLINHRSMNVLHWNHWYRYNYKSFMLSVMDYFQVSTGYIFTVFPFLFP